MTENVFAGPPLGGEWITIAEQGRLNVPDNPILGFRSDTVKHLKFETVCIDLTLSDEPLRGIDKLIVMRRDAGVPSVFDQDLHGLDEVFPDFRHFLIGDGGGFLVGTFA